MRPPFGPESSFFSRAAISCGLKLVKLTSCQFGFPFRFVYVFEKEKKEKKEMMMMQRVSSRQLSSPNHYDYD